MPTYVYKFVETGETIEVQQAFTDDALTEATHPGTGKVMQVKKVFTPVGVTFKGGGFYKTDSRGSSSSTKTGSSSSSSSSSDSSSSSGSTDSSSSASSAAPSSSSGSAASTS
ncbi:MAG: FmdB family transcriptional regulator [Ilumatobacteraceae bacterium]